MVTEPFCRSKNGKTTTVFLTCFALTIFFTKPHTKMTMVLRFSHQNDVGLRALNVVLWETLVLVVVLILESKALYYYKKCCYVNYFEAFFHHASFRSTTEITLMTTEMTIMMAQLLKKIAAYISALCCSACLCVKIHRFFSNTDLVILLRTIYNSIINKLMRHLLMQFSRVSKRFSSHAILHIYF